MKKKINISLLITTLFVIASILILILAVLLSIISLKKTSPINPELEKNQRIENNILEITNHYLASEEAVDRANKLLTLTYSIYDGNSEIDFAYLNSQDLYCYLVLTIDQNDFKIETLLEELNNNNKQSLMNLTSYMMFSLYGQKVSSAIFDDPTISILKNYSAYSTEESYSTIYSSGIYRKSSENDILYSYTFLQTD